ncbi:type II toxin-antitoxin system PemK/MazF family toxin [Streptomyces sp. TS71-3]|uniref:type II toxin-antitoxin system PemK/MazF family toxin n=1 Tax=Streptomyces sp. TS71-3 TaxID=2733862 RepID=UPI001B2D0220|nr:type II toxin-antitoxin system PemK/MazF family toxin [Streptomyces sp. TS71-3]GHJ37581.1 mRNA interferase [Streptomyces sp. TS71-3]
MKRGDIWLVDFEPARGHEANKLRPAVLVTNEAANRAATRGRRGILTVVPVTSNTTRILPFQVLLQAGDGGLQRDSKVQCEQIRSMDVSRFRRPIGAVPPRIMAEIDAALRIQLAL